MYSGKYTNTYFQAIYHQHLNLKIQIQLLENVYQYISPNNLVFSFNIYYNLKWVEPIFLAWAELNQNIFKPKLNWC